MVGNYLNMPQLANASAENNHLPGSGLQSTLFNSALTPAGHDASLNALASFVQSNTAPAFYFPEQAAVASTGDSSTQLNLDFNTQFGRGASNVLGTINNPSMALDATNSFAAMQSAMLDPNIDPTLNNITYSAEDEFIANLANMSDGDLPASGTNPTALQNDDFVMEDMDELIDWAAGAASESS